MQDRFPSSISASLNKEGSPLFPYHVVAVQCSFESMISRISMQLQLVQVPQAVWIHHDLIYIYKLLADSSSTLISNFNKFVFLSMGILLLEYLRFHFHIKFIAVILGVCLSKQPDWLLEWHLSAEYIYKKKGKLFPSVLDCFINNFCPCPL